MSIRNAINHVLQGERLDPAERRALDYVIASLAVEAGAELDELSLWYSDADDSFGGPDALFTRGYDQIVKGLADGLDIRLSHRITRVQYDDRGVQVMTDRGTFRADRAVVTMPLGVLQEGEVTFMPRLPGRKRAAINRLGMCVLNKVVVQFPRRFWSREHHLLGYMSDSRGEFPEFLNIAKYTGSPIHVALTGGAFARGLETKSDGQIVEHVMRVLKMVHGRNIPDPEQVAVTRWGSDQFSFGSYSHVPVGATDKDFDIMAEPVANGRLLFAGEATSRRYPGTVHGVCFPECERLGDQ